MLTQTNIWENTQNSQAVVYFTASWCVPCRQMKPQFVKAGVRDDAHDYYIVDVDQVDPQVLIDHQIQSVPQIHVFDSGLRRGTIEARVTDDIIQEVSEAFL